MGVEIVIVPPCPEMFASGLPPPPEEMGPTLYIFFITDIHPKKALEVLKEQRDLEMQTKDISSKVLQSASSLNNAGNISQNSNFNESDRSSYNFKNYASHVDHSSCTNLLHSETQAAFDFLSKKISYIGDRKKTSNSSSKRKKNCSDDDNNSSLSLEHKGKHSNSNCHFNLYPESELVDQTKIKTNSRKKKATHRKKFVPINFLIPNEEDIFSGHFSDRESEPHNTYLYCSNTVADKKIDKVSFGTVDKIYDTSLNINKKISLSKEEKSRSSSTADAKHLDYGIKNSSSSQAICELFSDSESEKLQCSRRVKKNLSGSKIKKSLNSKRFHDLFSSPETEKSQCSKTAYDKHADFKRKDSVNTKNVHELKKLIEEKHCDSNVWKSLNSNRIHELFSSPETEKSQSSKKIHDKHVDSKRKDFLNAKTVNEFKILTENTKVSKTVKENHNVRKSSSSKKNFNLFSDSKSEQSQSCTTIQEKDSKPKIEKKTEVVLVSKLKKSHGYKSTEKKKVFDSKTKISHDFEIVGNNQVGGYSEEVSTDVINSHTQKKNSLNKFSGKKDDNQGIVIDCKEPNFHLFDNNNNQSLNCDNKTKLDIQSNSLSNKNKLFSKKSRNSKEISSENNAKILKCQEISGNVSKSNTGRECRMKEDYDSELLKFESKEKKNVKNRFVKMGFGTKRVGFDNLCSIDRKYISLFEVKNCHVVLHDLGKSNRAYDFFSKSSASVGNKVILPSRKHISSEKLIKKNSKFESLTPSESITYKVKDNVKREVHQQSKIASDDIKLCSNNNGKVSKSSCKENTVLTGNKLDEHANFFPVTSNKEFIAADSKIGHIKNNYKFPSDIKNRDLSAGEKNQSNSKQDRYKFFSNAGTNIIMHSSKLHKSKCSDLGLPAIAKNNVLKEDKKQCSTKLKNGEIKLKAKRKKILSIYTSSDDDSLPVISNHHETKIIKSHESEAKLHKSKVKLSQTSENNKSGKLDITTKSEQKSRYSNSDDTFVDDEIAMVSQKKFKKVSRSDNCNPSENLNKTNESFDRPNNHSKFSPVRDCNRVPHITDMHPSLSILLSIEKSKSDDSDKCKPKCTFSSINAILPFERVSSNCKNDSKHKQSISDDLNLLKKLKSKEKLGHSKHRPRPNCSASVKVQNKVNFNHDKDVIIISDEDNDLDNIIFEQEPNQTCALSEKSIMCNSSYNNPIKTIVEDKSNKHKSLLKMSNENLDIEGKPVHRFDNILSSESKHQKSVHSKSISSTKKHLNLSNIKQKHLVQNNPNSKSPATIEKPFHSHDVPIDKLKVNSCVKFIDSKLKSLSKSQQMQFMKRFGNSKVVLKDVTNLSGSEFHKLIYNIKVEKCFMKKYYKAVVKANGDLIKKDCHLHKKGETSKIEDSKIETSRGNSGCSKTNVKDIKNDQKASSNHQKNNEMTKVPVTSFEKFCKNETIDVPSNHIKDKKKFKLKKKHFIIPDKNGDVHKIPLTNNVFNNFDVNNNLFTSKMGTEAIENVSSCIKSSSPYECGNDFFNSSKPSLNENKKDGKEKPKDVMPDENKKNQFPTMFNNKLLFCDSDNLNEKHIDTKKKSHSRHKNKHVQSSVSLKNERFLSKEKLKQVNKKLPENNPKSFVHRVKGPTIKVPNKDKRKESVIIIKGPDAVNSSPKSIKSLEKNFEDGSVINLFSANSVKNFKIPKLKEIKNQQLSQDDDLNNTIFFPQKRDKNFDIYAVKHENCNLNDSNNSVYADVHHQLDKNEHCYNSSKYADLDDSLSSLDEDFIGAFTSSPRRIAVDEPNEDSEIDNYASFERKCAELLMNNSCLFQSTENNEEECISKATNTLKKDNADCKLLEEPIVNQPVLNNKSSCNSRVILHSESKKSINHKYSLKDGSDLNANKLCKENKGKSLISDLQNVNSWAENDQKSLFFSCTKFSSNILNNICFCSSTNKCIVKVFSDLSSLMEESYKFAKTLKFGGKNHFFLNSEVSKNYIVPILPAESLKTAKTDIPKSDNSNGVPLTYRINSLAHTNLQMGTGPATNDEFVHLIRSHYKNFESQENLASLAKNLRRTQLKFSEKSSVIEDTQIIRAINYVQNAVFNSSRKYCKPLLYRFSKNLTINGTALPSDVVKYKSREKSLCEKPLNSTKVLGLPYSSAVYGKEIDCKNKVSCCRKIRWLKMKDFLQNDQYFTNFEDGSSDHLTLCVAQMQVIFQKKKLLNFVSNKNVKKFLCNQNVSFAIYTFVEDIQADHTEEILHQGCLYLIHHTAMIDGNLCSVIDSLSRENKLKTNIKNRVYLPLAIHHLCRQSIVLCVNESSQELNNLNENFSLITRLSNDPVMLKSKEIHKADNIKETSYPEEYFAHLKLFHAKLMFAHRRVALIIGNSIAELSSSQEFYQILTVQNVLASRESESTNRNSS